MSRGFTRATQQEHEARRGKPLVDTFPIAAGALVYSSNSSRKINVLSISFM